MSQPNSAVLVNSVNETRYLIPELVYEHDHPDVIYYTQYFTERAKRKANVFEKISAALKDNNNMDTAEKIAAIWHEFSKFVPAFIARAVSVTTDPEHQHHLIQIAYDELGAQDKSLIHSNLFLDALKNASIKMAQVNLMYAIRGILYSLYEDIDKIKSASGIIGLLLSFEIVAEINIETLFQGLGVDDARKEMLSESQFFKIHRADEVEHIRHSVANFLRFSKTQQEIDEAEKLFDVGIIFWKNFWDKIAEIIACE